MTPDRPGRWYLAAFLLAAGAHAALFTALPTRQAPVAAPAPGNAAPAEVELVAARPLEPLPPEPPPAPLPEPTEVPPEPEPAPESPPDSAAEPPPTPVATPEMPLPKPAPRAPAPPKNSTPSRKIAPRAASAKPAVGGSPGSSSGAVHEARPDTPRNRAPRYPEIARRNAWEGRVIVRASVTPAGRVSAVSLHRGSGHAVLDNTALQAVRGWLFLPKTVGGQAVASVVEVPVNFSLRR
ncbi:MAG TPA: energy transducer TonB [Chthoniobacterales bacterium]